MTDLPEALPILRHNTEATFGTLWGDNGSSRSSDDEHAGRISCRRPMIRQLCWGDAAEAGEVAASTATEGQDSGWQGFDLIVVRRWRIMSVSMDVSRFRLMALPHSGTWQQI